MAVQYSFACKFRYTKTVSNSKNELAYSCFYLQIIAKYLNSSISIDTSFTVITSFGTIDKIGQMQILRVLKPVFELVFQMTSRCRMRFCLCGL